MIMNSIYHIDETLSCKTCKFRNEEFRPISLSGAFLPVRVMFIGENPSWADNQEYPFSESTISGRALRKYYLKPLELNESEVWITDLFKCRYEKDVYRNKQNNDALIMEIASKCARMWLVHELALTTPNVVVTLSDKQVYQRLRHIFAWDTPKIFEKAAGKPHEVKILNRKYIIFPMVHPDVSRPLGDGDNRKYKTREKWAKIHMEYHIPALRSFLNRTI